MLPLLLALYAGMLGPGADPLRPYIDGEIAEQLGYIESSLGDREFLVGKDLTGADFMISFPLEAAAAGDRLKPFAGLTRYLDRLQARPAYKRALEKGGPYQLMAR